MKKKSILIIAIFLNISYICFAQKQEGGLRKAESLQIAFITKELALTPGESEKFWPLYDNYKNELREVIRDRDDDQIELEEKVLLTRKKYKNDFKTILGSDDRVNNLFIAERKFRNMLRKELMNRRMKRQ